MKSIKILLTPLYVSIITGYPGYDTTNLKSIINDAVTTSATETSSGTTSATGTSSGTTSETTSTVCDYTICIILGHNIIK